MSRTIDLDADGQVTFVLGGRELVVRQQRRALLEKVLNAMYAQAAATATPEFEEKAERTAAEVAGDNQRYAQACCQAWNNRLPIYCLIFGVDEGHPDRKGLEEHLQEHLGFPQARRIFTEWWTLNRISDFFALEGNPMITDDLIAAAIRELGTAVGTASPATPTSS